MLMSRYDFRSHFNEPDTKLPVLSTRSIITLETVEHCKGNPHMIQAIGQREDPQHEHRSLSSCRVKHNLVLAKLQ